ncbi:hypothetical protein C2G38_2035409 [Gigaspora rosea]|uniref:Uncharacterized protein n=1 Tax=Gigaspora rosea TaxID=44941 RepID=A0A397VEJ6_9GLOM|nr:hypothetical protein C2G38_2035409 [Gigaspora rosea]
MKKQKNIKKNLQSEEKIIKRSKHQDAEPLQELYQLHPDLNGQSVWFFPIQKKSAEGRILYEKSENYVYVYDMITQNRFSSFAAWIKTLSIKRFFKGKKSSLATIFLNSSCNGTSIGQIIKGENHSPYFKSAEIITLLTIKTTLTTMIYSNVEFANINLMEDIFSIVQFCKKSSICVGQYTKEFAKVVYLRGDRIYSSYLGPQNNHEIIATLENKGSKTEAYCRVDCTFFVLNGNICMNCKTLRNTLYKIEKRHANSAQSVKTPYVSREILTELVQNTRKTIRSQKELVKELSERLKLKFEAEEEPISEPLTHIVYNVIEEVKTKKYKDVPNIILKELIRIQSEKPNGIRYHPMFIRWAISIYSRGPAAYKAMKSIIRMPSLSTLKSYINKTSQYTGWQNKVVERIAANMNTNNIWGYARLGFFSHDSFKIQKGASNSMAFKFGSQREKNCIKCMNTYCLEVQLSTKPGKKSYKPSTIIAFNPECTEFLVELSGSEQSRHNITWSALRPPMPAKTTWNINDQCKIRNIVNNERYPGKISTGILINGYLDIEVAIKTTEIQPIIWKSVLSDIRPA